jgi:Fe-S cluster assembly protein SufD
LPSVALSDPLAERLASLDGAILASDRRLAAYDRFRTLRSGRERPGRYWRVDIESLQPPPDAGDAPLGTVTLHNPCPRVVVCDLSEAARERGDLLQRAFGATGAQATKFGALTAAFTQLGAFVYLPADVEAAEPIEISYEFPAGAVGFPYTVVLAESGARASIVQRCSGDGAFVCGVDEIVLEEAAAIDFAGVQRLSDAATIVQTRAAAPGRDASVAWACAELGAALSVGDISVEIASPGVDAAVSNVFFPAGTQHVDVVATLDHRVGDSTSRTLVKSAAVDRGQARFLGNIRIAPNAQGSDANLRDDALLLSPTAHVDSVPALEIAANDVKAYHGATVGAIDADQIFYMETRGVDRRAAERMIALGFFEPAIARFPGETLRAEIRAALQGKLA